MNHLRPGNAHGRTSRRSALAIFGISVIACRGAASVERAMSQRQSIGPNRLEVNCQN